jgi:hypothetical protein
MDLTKILSITGKPGLYQMIAQTKTGMVVESLEDGKRFTAFAHQRISSLEEISIFTYGEDMPLKEVFKKMQERLQDAPAPDPKGSDAELTEFFGDMVEDYDQERVYPSHIRKILSWYQLLTEKGMLEFEEEEKEQEQEKDLPPLSGEGRGGVKEEQEKEQGEEQAQEQEQEQEQEEKTKADEEKAG